MAWIGPIELSNGLLECGLQGLPHRWGHQHIVRGHTALAGIEEAAPGNAPSTHLQISIVQNDAGAFASQLKCHRYQLLSRGFHHLAADGGAAGEDHMIKGLLQQGLGCFCSAQFHPHHISFEMARHHLR